MVDLVLVDAGNTRIKWRGVNKQIVTGSEGDLIDFINHNQVRTVLLANVRATELENRIVTGSLAQVHVVKVKKHFNGLTVAYEEPIAMGVDRWLNMLAAHHKNRTQGYVVVSCGTAVTIDVLLAGQHMGGYILPGLSLQAKALRSYTANLPEVSVQEMTESGLGFSTRTAIARGIADSIRSLIITTHEGLQKQLSSSIIITGGDAKTLSESLDHPFTCCDQLIFEGMDVYLDHIRTQNES